MSAARTAEREQDSGGSTSPDTSAKKAHKKLLIRTDSASLRAAKKVYSLLSTPTQCLNSARRYLFMATSQSEGNKELKVFLRLELHRPLQTLIAGVGNGRMAGLKMSVRMEVARVCGVMPHDVEVVEVFEKINGADSAQRENGTTVVDIIVSPPAQSVGWNKELDLSLMARALMDQVEHNRHSGRDDLFSMMNLVEIKEHMPPRSSHSHRHLLMPLLILVLAQYYGVFAFSPGLRLPLLSQHPSRRSSTSIKMQVQTAVQDPPRYNDFQLALAGIVTRAERHTMALTGGAAARLNAGRVRFPAKPDSPRLACGTELGHGVYLSDSFRENSGGTLSPPVRDAVQRLHESVKVAAQGSAAHTSAPQHELVFSEEEVLRIRDAAHADYRQGQRTMTKFAHLLAQRVMSTDFECRSSVTAGGAPSESDIEEFRLSQQVSHEQLLAEQSGGSLELAERQLQGLFVDQHSSHLIDHEMEFEATESNAEGVIKVVAHAQPEAQAWRLVSEGLFALGAEAGAGAGPRHGAGEEKIHMFEVKLLVETRQQQAQVLHNMQRLAFSGAELAAVGLSGAATPAQQPQLLPAGSGAGSRVKMLWQGTPIAINVLTIDEHYIESELCTRAEAARVQASREEQILELEHHVPLYRFSRDALHWLLASSSLMHAPSCPRIALRIDRSSHGGRDARGRRGVDTRGFNKESVRRFRERRRGKDVSI